MKLFNLVTIIFLVLATSSTSRADTASDLEAAKIRKAIAEAQNDAAKAEAETATIMQEQKAKADKADYDASTAKFNAEKSQAEYYKTLLPTPPDLTKLKVEKPTEFEYKATINERYFDNTSKIGERIAILAKGSLTKNLGKPENAIIIMSDPSIKTATGLYIATDEALVQSEKILEFDRKLLQEKFDKVCVVEKDTKILWGGLPAVYVASELLKTVMGFAIALKPQYAIAHTAITVDKSEIVNVASQSLIDSKINVYDPEKIVPVDTLESKKSKLVSGYKDLVNTMLKTQVLLGDLNKKSCKLSDDAKEGAKKLKTTLDEVSKVAQGVMTATPSGAVPFDQALKAEELLNLLKQPKTFILGIELIRNENDSSAIDSIFSARKIHTKTNMQARWSLAKPNGQIIGSGIAQDTGEWKKVDLPN